MEVQHLVGYKLSASMVNTLMLLVANFSNATDAKKLEND